MIIEFDVVTRKNMKLFNLSYPYTKADLKKKYRKLVLEYHPDRNNNSEESTEKLKIINAAYVDLDKFALEKVNVKESLSEELKKKFANEKDDIFTLYNPCDECNGTGITYRTITVAENCTNCDGSGFVDLKCKYCEDGIFTKRNGQKVPCEACKDHPGIWRRVRCNQCNKHRRRSTNFWWNLVNSYYGNIGIVYKDKKIEQVCTKCEGRGKVKFEPLNPVIKKGAVLKTIRKRK